jgi:hypothetical protein
LCVKKEKDGVIKIRDELIGPQRSYFTPNSGEENKILSSITKVFQEREDILLISRGGRGGSEG